MHYIQSASTISYQETFQNPDCFASISELTEDADLIHPNYRDFIDPRSLRRMSKLLRMSLTCAKDCLNLAKIEQPKAIIMGTGLGALEDTEKFLNNFISIKNALLPPTSFIQSTHNTVAGQLSLLLKNHEYNMTHTQNTISFENALQDATLCLDEGLQNVLVGAADERIDFLDVLLEKLSSEPLQLTTGSSFFVLSKDSTQNSLAQITAIKTESLLTSFEHSTNQFLNSNNLKPEDIDLVLFSSLDSRQSLEIQWLFKDCEMKNFTNYCGAYMTNSAFAMHWAADLINNGKHKRVLICNLLNPINLGLTLIESCEA